MKFTPKSPDELEVDPEFRDEVREAVHNNLESVLESLLGEPSQRNSDEWRWNGGSLSVVVSGPKRGVWYDYAALKRGGGIFKLIMHERRCSYAEAVEWAREQTGLPKPDGRERTPEEKVAREERARQRAADEAKQQAEQEAAFDPRVIDGGLSASGGVAPPPVQQQQKPAAKPTPTTELQKRNLNLELLQNMPAREWIYGQSLSAGSVTTIGGAGGVGKTAYIMAVALSVALGRPLLGEEVHERGNVLVYNLEDGEVEMHRRLLAAMQHYGVSAHELDGLHMRSGLDKPLIIATETSRGPQREDAVEELINYLLDNDIKLLIVDPFIKSHRLSENKNEHLDFVATLWAEVAQRAQCAVVLIHHFRKGGVRGSADSFRGGSSLVDACRAALTLTKITPREARRFGIKSQREQQRYVHIALAKGNMSMGADETLWIRLTSVLLPNKDDVQVAERWEPPSDAVEVPAAEAVRVLEILSGAPSVGEQYTLDYRSKDRWAGKVLVDVLGHTEKQAKKTLQGWQVSGQIIETQYVRRSNRKPATGLRVERDKLLDLKCVSASVA
jgi:hypothetical protein